MTTVERLQQQIDHLHSEITNIYKAGNLGEWLDDLEVYNYDFLTTLNGLGRLEYKSVCVMIACGGPNIYIDTAGKYELIGLWGGDRVEKYLECEIVNEIDDYFEALFESVKGVA